MRCTRKEHKTTRYVVMDSSYLNNLNNVQKEVVSSFDGPTMVIAGAGSGKTAVLTYRIAELIRNKVSPFSILALTFTNKAAKEMKERIEALVENSQGIWMGTFHSVFARILRLEASLLGYPSYFTIYDQQDSESLIKKIIEDLSLDKDIYKPKHVLSRISQYKNNLITLKAYLNDIELQEKDALSMRPKMGEIYKAYLERCFQAGVMDFDDLLLKTNELINLFPSVLYKYQEQFRYILVDEYQDTNHSQYLIIKSLASRYENICIVGDDAQSIYSFRGANINNILNFQRDYVDVKIFRLEQNYRSTQVIVQAANSVIDQNKRQLKKKVWTDNKKGENLRLYRAVSDGQEASYVANYILRLKKEKSYNNKDFAVLYRTNAQSRALEEAFRQKNIPYRIYGGLSFFQRKEIKDFLAYLKVLINKKDQEALFRIINYPHRGIGESSLERIEVVSKQENKSFYEIIENIDKYEHQLLLKKGPLNKIKSFVIMIESLTMALEVKGLYELVREVAKVSGILDLLNQDKSIEGISRYENLQELIGSIQAYEEEQIELVDGDGSLRGFLSSISLSTEIDITQGEEDLEKVSLMSVHASKGLEFPIVFITGMEEGLFPSSLSLYQQEELEEERRLFYVALTRAKDQLFLSHCLVRPRWGKIIEAQPSRFIKEIDPSLMDMDLGDKEGSYRAKGSFFSPRKEIKKEETSSFFVPKKHLLESYASKKDSMNEPSIKIAIGNLVLHDRFGKGKVLKVQGSGQDKMAIVLFDEVGEKKLLLKFAKLRLASS